MFNLASISHTLMMLMWGKQRLEEVCEVIVQKQKTELSRRGALTEKYLTTVSLCWRTTGVLRKKITSIKHCTQ